MIKMTKRIPSVALIALLLVFGACKGESPTAPPPGGSIPPGGTTPPSGVTLTLTSSNADPLVDSTVVLTANVVLDGQPVPNGTAVEFSTNNGTFTDTQASTTIRTTTNGVASATLTAATPGATRISATVNNVTRTIDVTFRARPVTPPVPGTAPTIQSITPSIGRPSGGQTIRITGSNFTGPVKVLFDVGGPTPVEGFVVSRTDTAIEVITPPVNLGAGQERASRVIVITRAGSTNEQSVDLTNGFTFRNEQLTPRISTATPNSGPILGGTLVSIIGDGFQAPVQVLFGLAEARVVQVGFNEIIVEAPAGRDTSPTGSGVVTGPVDITVVNINSQTRALLAGGFRYVAAIEVIAAGPTEGPFTGGTRVTIDGNGFVAPVAVSIGGVAAQPIFVSGTRIIAVTSGVEIDSCTEQPSGPVTVTNISNGDQASGPNFTYRVSVPAIVNVTPTTVQPGGTVTVTVINALPAGNRIKIGDKTVFATPVFATDGSATFTVVVPTTFTFATEACTVSGVTGTRQVPTVVDVSIDNGIIDGCTDTVDDALTILPCAVPPCPCSTPANAAISGASLCPATTGMPGVSAAGTATSQVTFTVTNNGGDTLILSQPTSAASSNATTVTVGPPTAPTNASLTLAPGQSTNFTVFVDPAAAGAFTTTIRVSSNDADTPVQDLCFSGTATP